ncbi:hypothetical protein [Parafilimonas sp.]|uniref:hypothetical protein n=1 Tax=Parafilimonas sp. TaxID=1969739 RepID=UPI003F7F63E7
MSVWWQPGSSLKALVQSHETMRFLILILYRLSYKCGAPSYAMKTSYEEVLIL